MSTRPQPSPQSAAKHSPDYPTCASGGYDHLWQINDKGIGTCTRCPATRQFGGGFETRWAHIQAKLKEEMTHA